MTSTETEAHAPIHRRDNTLSISFLRCSSCEDNQSTPAQCGRGVQEFIFSGFLVQMPEPVSLEPALLLSSSAYLRRQPNGTNEADDAGKTMDTVAKYAEQLHANISSPHDKDLIITAQLLGIAKDRKDARLLIGSHNQAMPLFISVLGGGTPGAKVNVASILTLLCKDQDLRLKVLLGGGIPPLLSLLKSDSNEARKAAAAEAIFVVSSAGLADDHVGAKIFVTEGVVPTLWWQLNSKGNKDKVVEGFVTGALRNLCGDKDGYWRATLASGGVDIILGLLSSDNSTTQSNAASLLARLILAFSDSIPNVIDSCAVEALLHLVGWKNDASVRLVLLMLWKLFLQNQRR